MPQELSTKTFPEPMGIQGMFKGVVMAQKSISRYGLSGLICVFALATMVFAQDTTSTQPEDTYSSQQPVTPMSRTPVYRVQVVGRSTRALNYRNHASNNLEFEGTHLNPEAKGKGKVVSEKGRMRVSVEFEHLPKPETYGPEFLTYVLWAITPQGRPQNLGEVLPDKNGKRELTVTTDLQAFGLIVTAEPYFAVTLPSDEVVLENVFKKNPKGWELPIEAKFDALQRGEYTVEVPASQLAAETAEEKMPTDLKEAINAVAIAKAAGAQQYAADTLSKAEDFLARGQDYYRRKQGDKAISTVARGAVQNAEDARLLTIRRKREEAQRRQEQETEEAQQARLRAEQQQQASEQQAQLAEQQRQQAELQKQQAEAERYRAEQARVQADQAALQAQQAQAQALAQQQAAESERQRALQQAQQAEQEKEQTRARLMQQLNQVLQTRESARGLIVSMPDVLFDFNKYTLKPEARERLAKVSGILLAYPGLNVQVEGHTDSIGSDEYNQKLSQERADTVRGFLVSQGVASNNVTAEGFGKRDPIASNDSASGRQQNRRVELVVNGTSIGEQAAPQSGTQPGGQGSPSTPGAEPGVSSPQPATPPPTVNPPSESNPPPH